ncbi:MAG: hypothetical protein V1779_14110 [bacterium]
MEYNTKILDLVSGDLSPDNEEEIYFALASNDGLRNDAREIFALKSAIRTNSSSFFPPSYLKDNIYNSVSSTIFPGKILPKKRNKSKKALYFSAGVISTILIFLFSNLIGFRFEKLNDMGNARQIIEKPISHIESNNIAISGKEARPIQRKSIINIGTNKIITESELTTESFNELNTTDLYLTEKIAKNLNIEYASSDNYFMDEFQIPRFKNDISNTLIFPPNTINSLEENFMEPYNMLISFSGAQSWFFSSNPAPSQNSSIMNNGSLAIYYKLSDYFALGGELRMETFGQRAFLPDTTMINKYGEQLTYERQEDFLTSGVSLFITSKNKDGLFPDGKITLGYASSGMILRVMSGLAYQVSPNYFMEAGIEYNDCFYKTVDDRTANSRKLNFVYSIYYSF